MTVYRKWFCNCTGSPRELDYNEVLSEDGGEPVCPRCGATPSSDPKRTITFRDQEDWED